MRLWLPSKPSYPPCSSCRGEVEYYIDIKEMAWYATRVFFNKTEPLVRQLEEDAVHYYLPPSNLITSLLFVDCEEAYLRKFQQDFYGKMFVYGNRETRCPVAIRDAEMRIFILVTSSGEEGLTYLGDDRPEYHQGDRVRVTAGPFQGAEGHIKRIKKDRRLIISLQGIVAVATAYIHPDLLEKVEKN